MSVRTFALAFGVVYVVIGVLGFLPGIVQPPPPDAPDLAVQAGYGYLLGLFPINVVHNLVHLAIGILGIVAYRGVGSAVLFARGLAIVYGLLTVLGLIPGLNTVFGLVPIFGTDIVLHVVSAAVAAYFGWMHHDRGAASTAGRSAARPGL